MMQFNKLFLLSAAVFPCLVSAHYRLLKDYSSFDFTSGSDFYNGPDPTNGHVQYKGYATANATGLVGFLVGPNGTNIDNSTLPPPIYLGVDYINVYSKNVGRPSVRVSSVQTYNHSLIIADILHMPSSTCGLWPAFWMLGTASPWPNAGEIDILENVNDNDFNMMTLHTSAGVTVSNNTNLFNGTMKTSNCDVSAQGQEKNAGCSIKDKPEVNSYGTNFNTNKGGVFVMQYTSEHIAIWFFPRTKIPEDIKVNTPSPPFPVNASSSAWGKPNALFQPQGLGSGPTPNHSSSASSSTSSSASGFPSNTIVPLTFATYSNTTSALPSTLDDHFTSLQILFTTTFCGDWAGRAWNATSCGKLAPTCEEYVSANPGAFKDAFWAIQGVKVYMDTKEARAPAAKDTGMKMAQRKRHEHKGWVRKSVGDGRWRIV